MTDIASRREQRRLEHHALNRNQVLDAAEEVFGNKGFHSATLKEIAEQAGFAVGSVYTFFENKDDLFRQLFTRRGGEFVVGMHEAIGDPDGDPVAQLHALIDFQVGFFREHRRFGRLFLRYSSPTLLSPQRRVDQAVGPDYDESMRLQAELFARGQEAGCFRAGDVDVLAHLFSGLVSTFQSVDPAVMTDEAEPAERFTLAELHDLIARAFAP